MRLRTLTLTLWLALCGAGCAAPGAGPTCGKGEEHMVNELLYFGTARPQGVVSADEWTQFLRTAVTPRFPQGLTAWPAAGQWKGADSVIVREDSFLLSLLHPDDEASDAAVRAIAAEYKSRFQQEAVLRVKSRACVSF